MATIRGRRMARSWSRQRRATLVVPDKCQPGALGVAGVGNDDGHRLARGICAVEGGREEVARMVKTAGTPPAVTDATDMVVEQVQFEYVQLGGDPREPRRSRCRSADVPSDRP